MLQSLRDNSKGVISGILIGFLVIIFAVSGSEALFNFDPATKGVVSVNGEDITEIDIARASANYKRQMAAQYGDSLPADFLSDENIRQPVIENLIQQKVLTQAAEDAGMTIGDDSINQQILSTPQFQGSNGTFDPNVYQQLLRTAGFTPANYKKALAEDALVNQLSAGVVDSSFVTPAELETIIALSFQTRDFSYAIIPAAKISENVEVSEAEIDAYYQANTQSFTHPEQVAVDYIDLNVADLMAGIDITEEQARQQFAQNVAAFEARTEREAAHILIEDNDEAKIAEVSEKLAAGEDFAELAKTYSDDLGTRDQGGDLGFTSGDAFPEAFESALAALEVGAVSAPVKTDAGTHFIKLVSERGSEPPTFEEERNRIVDQLKRAEAENQFVNLLERLRDLSYNAENLAEVAEELGLQNKNTGLFGRNGGEGIAAEPQFVTAAFSDEVLQENNSSDVIELAPNRVAVLKKTEHQQSYIKPLDEVKEQITKIVRDNKVQSLLAARAQEIEAAVASGKTLEAAVADAGYEIKVAEGVERNDVSVDRDVLRQAFSLAKPQGDAPITSSTRTSSGDHAVISLSAVNLGGKELPEEQKTAIAAQLKNITGQGEYASYRELLRESASIKR
ncbi:MAG TPA: SurA N-terminal domain-containing protein [Cellvibrio sp.]|nr:SurA N-terminal domain-containing protein [Cellvibrio sp.]